MTKLSLIFKNEKFQTESISYSLTDSIISAKWIKKIKHLQKIRPNNTFTPGRPIINLVERYETAADNLETLHREYCKFAGIEYIKLDYSNKETLNQLDEIYDTHYERLKTQKDNNIVYQFNSAINTNRKYDTDGGNCKQCLRCVNCLYRIGWGPTEGPLKEEFKCNPYYAKHMLKNNLYLPWAAELGKTPLQYFTDQKSASIEKLIESTSPHTMLRASFAICQVEKHIETFSEEFENWFQPFKDSWLTHYGLEDWRPRDEHSAVLLAECDDQSFDTVAFLDAYPFFDSIVIKE